MTTATAPGIRSASDLGSVPEALTSDAWYTLLYLSPAERRELAVRRRRIWSAPLVRAGTSRSMALELLARRDRWARREEARGRTPPVLEQLERLAAWARTRLEPDAVARQLDDTLLRARVRLADGALDAVRSLDRAGVPLGIVSNVLNESGSAARTMLERLGLLPSFRVVVLSCEHPWAKPAPGPFRLACRFLGVAPSSSVHVGDLDYDLRGAREAGMEAWWYVGLRRFNRYLPGQVNPDHEGPRTTVRSWSEVARRLAPRRGAGARSRRT